MALPGGNAPTNIALRVTESRKPHLYDNVVVLVEAYFIYFRVYSDCVITGEDEGRKFVTEVDKHVPDYMVS
jgi:hypothetical protein